MNGKRHLIISIMSFTTLIVIGWLDFITGYEFGFFIFYFIPVSISAWLNGRNAGLLMACMSAACWYLSDYYSHHPYSKAYLIYWEMWIRWLTFLTTALTVAKIRELIDREKQLKIELTKVNKDNDELRELLNNSESNRHNGNGGEATRDNEHSRDIPGAKRKWNYPAGTTCRDVG
jgi:K+-sensing histidine kinase KdpD